MRASNQSVVSLSVSAPALKWGNREKMVVIMGATGTGKSRLSIDLATRFPSEIINSDKMQVFKGLDLTTNKIPISDRRGVPHHLLGDIETTHSDLGTSDYSLLASQVARDVAKRGKLPLLVGGSNSFVEAFVNGSGFGLGFEVCFLWVDVDREVLRGHLDRRVDQMVSAGMVAELAAFYDPEPASRVGIRRAIGVPEFDRFFSRFGITDGFDDVAVDGWDRVRRRAYQRALLEIKENTWRLAVKQCGRIDGFRNDPLRWDLRRLDATEAIRVTSSSSEMWESRVLEPSVKLVERFLDGKLD